MNKVLVVMYAGEDAHFESQHVDCELMNGVYSYTDSKSEHHEIFVFDVDISQQMLEAVRQYYYHVKRELDFVIPASQLIVKNEESQAHYVYRDEVLDRFFKSDVRDYKSLDGFDYQTHKHLIDQY